MGMRIPEFYPEMQARPLAQETRDLETRQTSLYTIYIALWEEYMRLLTLVDRLLNEQIELLGQLTLESKQIKLHLASMSDTPIDEDDVEVE